jgi:RNA polymerase-binding transcription factor DksA
MVVTTARFAPRTLASLTDLLRARQASEARCAEALRTEVAGALSQRDLSDLFDQEDPSVDTDTTTALMLVGRVERLLWEVEQALARVADGTYGYCIDCGIGIPLERLRALPATARCVGCSHRFSHWTRELVRDHLSSDQIPGRSLAGLGSSVWGA